MEEEGGRREVRSVGGVEEGREGRREDEGVLSSNMMRPTLAVLLLAIRLVGCEEEEEETERSSASTEENEGRGRDEGEGGGLKRRTTDGAGVGDGDGPAHEQGGGGAPGTGLSESCLLWLRNGGRNYGRDKGREEGREGGRKGWMRHLSGVWFSAPIVVASLAIYMCIKTHTPRLLSLPRSLPPVLEPYAPCTSPSDCGVGSR